MKCEPLQAYAVVHRREVVVLTFASLGEGGISRPFRLDVLVPVQRVQRAEERTRTADLISLRVITQALQGCAGNCKCRIDKPFALLRLALCCTVPRSRWYQSGIRCVMVPICTQNRLRFSAQRGDANHSVRFERIAMN